MILSSYEKCLEVLPGDKPLNAVLAWLLTKHFPLEGGRAEYYWRRSFTDGDSNYNSQFWYARQLFVGGKQQEAKAYFQKLRAAQVSPDAKSTIRGQFANAEGAPLRFSGVVERLEATYAWLSVEGEGYWVFLHRSKVASSLWESLRKGGSLDFGIGFNFAGPAAFQVKPRNSKKDDL